MDRNEYSHKLKEDAINYLKGAFSLEDLKTELSFRRIRAIRTQIRNMNRRIEELAEEVSVLDRQVLSRRRNNVLKADSDNFGELEFEILECAISELEAANT